MRIVIKEKSFGRPCVERTKHGLDEQRDGIPLEGFRSSSVQSPDRVPPIHTHRVWFSDGLTIVIGTDLYIKLTKHFRDAKHHLYRILTNHATNTSLDNSSRHSSLTSNEFHTSPTACERGAEVAERRVPSISTGLNGRQTGLDLNSRRRCFNSTSKKI